MSALAITQNNFVASVEILDNVVNILSDKIDKKKAIKKLTSLIPKAHRHLTEVRDWCQGETDHVSREIEGMVSKISQTRNDIAAKNSRVGELHEMLCSLDKQIDSCKNQREEAQRSLDRANQKLRDQQDELERRKNEQTVTTFMSGFLPLTSGMGMATGLLDRVMQERIQDTERNIDTARSDVRSSENTLASNLEQRRSIEQQRCREDEELERTKKILANLEADLACHIKQQDKMIVLNEKLKETCHFVTALWGKSRVLDKEAKHLYTLESLLIPLNEIAGMLQMDEEKREKVNMLLTKDLKMLGKGMETKMMAICQSMQLELDLV